MKDSIRVAIATGAAAADPADAITIAQQIGLLVAHTDAAHIAVAAGVAAGISNNPTAVQALLASVLSGSSMQLTGSDAVRTQLAGAMAAAMSNSPAAIAVATTAIANSMSATGESDREALAVSIAKSVHSSNPDISAVMDSMAAIVGGVNSMVFASDVAGKLPTAARSAIAAGVVQAFPTSAAAIVTAISTSLPSMSITSANAARTAIAAAAVNVLASDSADAGAVINGSLSLISNSTAAYGSFAAAIAAQTPAYAAMVASAVAGQESTLAKKTAVLAPVVQALATNPVALQAVVNATEPSAEADKITFVTSSPSLSKSAAQNVAAFVALSLPDDATRISFAVSLKNSPAPPRSWPALPRR